MNLKVPGATLPLGCAILREPLGGLVQPPLGELGLILNISLFTLFTHIFQILIIVI